MKKLFVALIVLASTARADSISGTWAGTLRLQSNSCFSKFAHQRLSVRHRVARAGSSVSLQTSGGFRFSGGLNRLGGFTVRRFSRSGSPIAGCGRGVFLIYSSIRGNSAQVFASDGIYCGTRGYCTAEYRGILARR